MRKNELRKIIADGRTVLNAWLAIANPFSAELMAHQGFDAVTIDLQHGPVDFLELSPSHGPSPRPVVTDNYSRSGLCIAAKAGCSCPVWVINDRRGQSRPVIHVRFAPKADKRWTKITQA